MVKFSARFIGLVAAFSSICFAADAVNDSTLVPILCYHRISNGKPGNTTVTPENFRLQLQSLRDNGFHVIPLSELVAWKGGTGPAPKPHSIVITFDDGHESFFTSAQPIIDEFKVPVTEFLVVNCISNGTYCVTWDEVAKLQQDPLIDLESHTWSHPTFPHVLHRNPTGYAQFVDSELTDSKNTLEKKLNRPVPLLAWPYGLYSPMLLRHAAADGYRAAFSVQCRAVSQSDPQMAMPRCMVLNSYVGPDFLKFLSLIDKAATATPVNTKWRVMPLAPKPPAPQPAE